MVGIPRIFLALAAVGTLTGCGDFHDDALATTDTTVAPDTASVTPTDYCIGVNCADGNPCTIDSCVTATGVCDHAPVLAGPPPSAACKDNDACTDDVCSKGLCAHVPRNCDDGDPCTLDTCTWSDGCHYAFNLWLCDDGNNCTLDDQCLAGVCHPGKPMPCEDFNACTTDFCDAKGCHHTASAICGDGKCECAETSQACPADCIPCDKLGYKSTCAQGYCYARSPEGGGNVCIVDAIDPAWPDPMPEDHPAKDFTGFADFDVDLVYKRSWAHEYLGPFTWAEAATACTGATYGGFHDWRLPTGYELTTLIDWASWFRAQVQGIGLTWPDQGAIFWTGTAISGLECIATDMAEILTASCFAQKFVRCVR